MSAGSRPAPGPRSARRRRSIVSSRWSPACGDASTRPSRSTHGGPRSPGPPTRGRGDGQRHQRFRRPRLCGGRGGVRCRRGRHAHPARPPGGRSRPALRRCRRRGGLLPVGAGRARQRAGIPPERIVLDAGFDLGKTADQSLILLRASSTLAGLGYPLLLSASNKTFLGKSSWTSN